MSDTDAYNKFHPLKDITAINNIKIVKIIYLDEL